MTHRTVVVDSKYIKLLLGKYLRDRNHCIFLVAVRTALLRCEANWKSFNFYLFFSYLLNPNHSFCSLLSSRWLLSLFLFFFRSIPPPYPFRKGEASKRYPENMAYQLAVRLSTAPHIKAGVGNLVERKGSQKLAKDSKTAPPSHC